MSLEQQLIESLNQLEPSHLEVINESAGHGGYFPGKESHFKVIIVSEQFAGLRFGTTPPKSVRRSQSLTQPWKNSCLSHPCLSSK